MPHLQLVHIETAEWVNLLPISVILQPWGQQKRVEPVHVQCFWNSQKPTPDLDQSVARQVGFDLSKILIPCSISFTIVACDSLKACSKAGVQEKVDPALRRGRNGSMTSVTRSVYDAWLTSPNQERISVIEFGLGNSSMLLVKLVSGLTLVFDITNPAKSISSSANLNFDGLRTMPLCPQRSR